MSDDAIKAELRGVRSDVAQLREEGKERGKKIDSMLVKTAEVEVRVGVLEKDNGEHKRKFKEIESKLYKIGFWAAVALGGAAGTKEILSLF
ncbi:MAG: hypothetical protein E7037_04850 [Verrucomicrobia bacterium]|nr:hypothetical protein [Verrucomicrobiota bacterium]